MEDISNGYVYLAGGMTGLSHEEATIWRKAVEEWLHNYFPDLKIFNPCNYYELERSTGIEYEREAKEFDLYKLRNSRLVIVNFNSKYSTGTSKELTFAHLLNIPIIGLNQDGKTPIHPWDVTDCNVIFDNMSDMLYYIKDFYLDYNN